MTPRTPQCEVFCPLLSSSKHSGVLEDSQPPTFPSVGLHPHTWPKWGCDSLDVDVETNICYEKLEELMVCMKCKMMEVIILMFCFEFHTYLEGTIGGKGTFFSFSNMFKNSKLSMVGSLCSKLMKSCIAH